MADGNPDDPVPEPSFESEEEWQIANSFFVEEVGYQKAAIQEMEQALLRRPDEADHRQTEQIAGWSRRTSRTTVLFPRGGWQLLGQVFNLGVESHDDLCDALVWLLQGLVSQEVQWIEA
jgi:hypothetical protein